MTNTPHTPEIIQDKYGAEIEVSRATVESLLAQRNELREALKAMVDMLDSGMDEHAKGSPWYIQARAALAKANP